MRRRAVGLLGATLLSAVGLAACGGSSTGLIPATNAGVLSDDLSSLSSELSLHSCAGVDAALGRIEIDISNLPGSVERRLRNNLDAGYNDLDNVARNQCQAPKAHHVSNGNSGHTGTTHSTGATQTTTGPTQTTTGPTQTTTGPTQTTSPTSPTSPTVGPGGGAPAPSGSTGASGSTLGGTTGF